MMFVDRVDAGRQLAARLEHLRGSPVVVLGLPRGGVPVACEVATELGMPLDVIVVRKLGMPFQPELGMGAVGEGGVRVLNEEIVRMAGVSDREIAAVEARERVELDRRARRFRGDRPPVPLAGHTALVIDDGIATGSTARTACQVARAQGAARVVLAVPVAPPGWEARIGPDADEFVCLATPEMFFAIGQFYEDFSQTTDDEVVDCLERAGRGVPVAAVSGEVGDDPPARDEEVVVQAGPVRLGGHLTLPEHPLGVVVFAHGSGSSRRSPRNRDVAGVLNQAGIGTLLFDLLTVEEELDRTNVFDIGLLARRLSDVTRWLRTQPDCAGLSIGYFGASTGAAAALWAAVEPGADVAAVVSRGGRPDLAGSRLPEVTAPTLLIVGGRDDVVLDLNRQAQARLHCESRLVVVPGATHLFEEPGTLQAAAVAARDWFASHFSPIAAIGALSDEARPGGRHDAGPQG
ncbi:MAG TPA: phosphoribosyltransferase family protein [Acidimicrobiales bacterium]|nr:phosphoribosyltransferase family protein [Acidimicrobiales bacterium]